MTWIVDLTRSDKLVLFNYMKKDNDIKWAELNKKSYHDDSQKENTCKNKKENVEAQILTNLMLKNKIKERIKKRPKTKMRVNLGHEARKISQKEN